VGEQRAEEVVRRIVAGEAHEASALIAELTRRTPLLTSRGLSDACGGQVVLKAENLQRTGSFKLRGAAHRIARLVDPSGVVAGSAGNHGQSLAYAARAREIPCEVFMPREAPVAKVAAVQAFGGTVDLDSESVDEAVARAIERAEQTGAAFVHPFDDPDVILGQATLGLELLEDVPDLDTVIVPVGGGGLISGVAGVIKEARPHTRVVGVQAAACAAFPPSLAHGTPETITPRAATIADGIAVKRPGETTLALVRRWVDEIVVVDEDETADAMVWLLERSKLVVEGGGAVGVAALLLGAVPPAADGATCVILSGGNVDAGLLAQIAQRHEVTEGRRLRLLTRISDRPGALAALLTAIAHCGGNVVHADHVREATALHVRETAVEITLETRGPEHGATIVAELEGAGYQVQRLDSTWPAA
jgi:threonine dehydratase